MVFTKKDEQYARWAIVQATEVPDQIAKVKRLWNIFQKSMQCKWPSRTSKAGEILAQLVKERDAIIAGVKNHNKWRIENGKAVLVDGTQAVHDINARINAFAIEPTPASIEAARKNWEKENQKLQSMRLKPWITKEG